MKKSVIPWIIVISVSLILMVIFWGMLEHVPYKTVIEYIGYILVALIPVVYPWFFKKWKFAKLGITPSAITPDKILSGRGQPTLGFNEDLYYGRDIDGELKELFEKQGTTSIIMISGGMASGKSRVVFEFIKSSTRSDLFRRVYVVTSDNIKCMAENLTSNDTSELIVIDDVDVLYKEEKDLLLKLLKTVHQSKFKVAMLTYANESELENDNENIRKWIDHVSKPNPENRSIEYLEIPEITPGDEVHDWCMANMTPTRPPSPVIGAYVKEAGEYINTRIKKLLENNNAVDLLAAYITIAGYRKKQSRQLKYVFLMYAAQQEEKTLRDFNDGLNALVDVGYISIEGSRYTKAIIEKGGRTIGEDQTVEWCREEIIKGEIVFSKSQSIHVKDKQLLAVFSYRVAVEDLGSQNATITRYLLHNEGSEINQVKALIRIDPRDPEYYSRAITKTLHASIANVIKEVEQLLVENRILSGRKEILVKEKLPALVHLIGIIISRKEWRSFAEIKEEIEAYLREGLVPDMTFMAELLRVTIFNPIKKEEMYHYIDTLISTYSPPPDIYYYQCIEQIEKDLDIDAVIEAIPLLKALGRDERDESSRSGYCSALLKKAISKDRMDQFFDEIIATVKETESYIIRFTKFNILDLMKKLKGSNTISKGELLLYLIKKLQSTGSVKDCSMQELYVNAVMLSDTYRSTRWIYDDALPNVDNKSSRVMALSLFEKIEKEADYWECLAILNDFMSKEAEDGSTVKGSLLKLFNKLLSHAPTFDEAIQMLRSNQLDYDIITINSLFKIIYHNINKDMDNEALEKLTESAIKINQLRDDGIIFSDDVFLSNFYRLQEFYMLNDMMLPDSVNEIITGLKEKEIKSNPVLESQEIRVMSLKCVLIKAQNVLQEMKRGTAVYSDIITALIDRAIKYENQELREIVDAIIGLQDRITDRSVHYYCRLIGTRVQFKKYGDVIDLSLLKDDILKAFMDLNDNRQPLFDGNFDIVSTVISHLNFNQAKEILLYARDLSERYKNIRDLSKILRSQHIVDLCRLIDIDDSDSELQMEEIQELINQNQGLRLDDNERGTINNINKTIRGIPILYTPLMNENRDIRHGTWDQMVRDRSIDNADSKDIQSFVKMEIVDITRKSRIPGSIDDSYLIEAMDILRERSNPLDPFVNNAYLKHKRCNHGNFFEAFLHLGCIAPSNMDKWYQLASHFGYDLR